MSTDFIISSGAFLILDLGTLWLTLKETLDNFSIILTGVNGNSFYKYDELFSSSKYQYSINTTSPTS